MMMSGRQRFYVSILASLLLVLPIAADAAATAAPPASTACTPCSEAANPHLQRFYDISDQMQAAYKAKEFAKAKALADEYLALAPQFSCDWNYGNAVHDGNEMLGLLSLRAGDTDAAAKYLIQAGKSKGSPQLGSFGPDMELANALLQAGKVLPVKIYLNEIKSFWPDGSGTIDAWLADIDKGQRPHLDRAEAPPMAASPLRFVLYGALVWPALAVLIVLLVRRARLRGRSVVFVLAGLVLAYGVFFGWSLLGMFLLDVGGAAIINLGSWILLTALTIVYMVSEWLLPLLAVFLLARFIGRARAE